MNWWSAQNWCQTLGLKPVTRADIGCEEVPMGEGCVDASPIKASMQEKWYGYANHWLEIRNDEAAYYVRFDKDIMSSGYLYSRVYALCH